MIGSTISHYRIVSQIGKGGMGVVYLAEDTRLERRVALKFLPPESMEEQQKQRFLREARMAALIHHPNICPIHEVDEVDGRLFFAMAYLEGKPLSRMIDGRPMDISRALDIAIQIAGALEEAHKHGIVHRDIKSNNLIVDHRGHVYILDFGLALRHGSSRLTVDGRVVGTPAYMSPEQAQGLAVDHRTDLWSLGVVLFELLTGRLPFRRERDLAVIHAIVNEEAPPLLEMRSTAPAALERFVETALAKRPEDRWQSAGEMAAELRRIRASPDLPSPDASTVTMRVTAAPPPRRRFSRARVPILILAVLIALGLLWKWGRLGGLSRLPEEKHIAVLPFEVIGPDDGVRAIADGLVETLTAKLSQMEQFQGKLVVVPASEIRSSRITSAAEARKAYGANLVITGSAQRLQNMIQFAVHLVDPVNVRQLGARSFDFDARNPISLRDGALNGVISLLELQISQEARRSVSQGESSSSGAYAEYLKGRGYLARYDVAGNIDQALTSFQNATKEDPHYALAHSGLAEAYMWKARVTGDKYWSDRAIKEAEQAVQLDPNLGMVHARLGEMYARNGQEEAAIRQLQQALQLSPGNADAYRELATVYANLGRFREAEASFQEAIQRRPTDWHAHFLLARFYRQRSRYNDAESAYNLAKKLTPDNVVIHRALADLYRAQGRYSDARAQLQTTLKIEPTARAYGALGIAYYYEHRFQEAASALETAIDLDSSRYAFWGNLGAVYQRIPGQQGKAQPALRRAIELGEKMLEVTPKDYTTRINLAEYHARLGESKKAAGELSNLPPALREQNLIRLILVYELLGMRKSATDCVRELQDPAVLNEIKNDPDLERLWTEPSIQDTFRRLRGRASN
jgi:serine/threonine-protein kinase